MSIKLPEQLTIRNANEIKAKCLQALEGDDDLSLDASEVKNIDTAGIQFIISYITEVEKIGKKFVWKHKCSDDFLYAVAKLNVETTLRINEVQED